MKWNDYKTMGAVSIGMLLVIIIGWWIYIVPFVGDDFIKWIAYGSTILWIIYTFVICKLIIFKKEKNEKI